MSRLSPDLPAGMVSSELELLLLCARTQLDVARAQRIRTLAEGGLDWRRVLALAAAHGLAPLLHRHLSEEVPFVPMSVVEQLRVQVQTTTRRSLVLLRELLCLLELFEANQVRAVPYKGPALASLLYGDISLRPCSDLDILVHPDDVGRAIELLQERHYGSLRGERIVEVLKRDCEFEMVSADGKVVDIHWNIAPEFFSLRFDADAVWRNLQSAWVHGRALRVMPEQLLLPILCVHGTKHRWQRLQWICDVSLILERLGDCDVALRVAERMNARRMLLVGAGLSRALLGTALPDEAQRAVNEDRGVARLVRRVCECLDRPPAKEAGEFLRTHTFVLASHAHVIDRLRYLSRLAMRPSRCDRALVNLPKSLRILYMAVKPLRLAVKLASAGMTK